MKSSEEIKWIVTWVVANINTEIVDSECERDMKKISKECHIAFMDDFEGKTLDRKYIADENTLMFDKEVKREHILELLHKNRGKL